MGTWRVCQALTRSSAKPSPDGVGNGTPATFFAVSAVAVARTKPPIAVVGVVLALVCGCSSNESGNDDRDATSTTFEVVDPNSIRFEPAFVCGEPNEQIAVDIVNGTAAPAEISSLMRVVDDAGQVVEVLWLGFGDGSEARLLPPNGTLPPIGSRPLEAGASTDAVVRLPAGTGTYTVRNRNTSGELLPPTLTMQVGGC